MSGGLHESFDRADTLKGGSDRGFGLTVGGILVLLGLVRWWRHGYAAMSLGTGMAVVGLVLVVLGLAAPASLGPLNRAWTRLGVVLSKIVSPVAMLLIFVFGIVPVGLIRRALGHDPLRLKRDPSAPSYWIDRTPPGPPPETLINQF